MASGRGPATLTPLRPGSDEQTQAMTGYGSVATGTGAERPVIGGRYEVLGLLGAGGMGSVYRVRDRELDEVVALKMLKRELMALPGVLERFKREVKLARRVTHPNVARTFDIGEHEGEKFLTMEYIDGEPLSAELARGGALSVARALSIARAACAGLTAAHSAGVVHRDLKPDNVMLEKSGRVVVTDFGIARTRVEDASPGKTVGVAMGTPAYMAPEQVEAAENVDGRADIYALGVTLFQMLTDELPWQGDSPFALAAARLTAPPPDPRTQRPDLPEAVAGLVLRCMARSPDDRPASARDLARTLAELISTWSDATEEPPISVWRPALPADPTPAGDKAVAVLPFRNAGPPDDQYIADGLTEDLIDTLSMAQGLRLRPHSAVVAFTGAVDSREVGRELGVQVVVEGSLRRAGPMLRIAARLISVADGFQLWARRFDRPANDLLVVSDEAAAAIAEALTVAAAAPVRAAPTDPRAVELYLKARAELRRQWRAPVERSVELFRQALALAPGDATILAGYARACVRLWFFNGDENLGDEAERLAEQALARAPEDSDSLVAMAGVHFAQRRVAAAARQVQAALSRAPLLADAHHLLGVILGEIGRPELAVAQLQSARQLDPGLRAGFDLARLFALLGRYDEAQAILQRPAEDPESRISALSLEARISLWRNDVDRAARLRPALDAASTTEPIEYARLLVSLLERGSLGPDALAFMEMQLTVRRGRQMVLVHQLECEAFARAGNQAGALQQLDRAVDTGLHDLTWLQRCPVLDSLRSDARFGKAHSVVAERARQVRAALGLD